MNKMVHRNEKDSSPTPAHPANAHARVNCTADDKGTLPCSGMRIRTETEDLLARAEQTAALGRSHIERQRQIVSELERDGHDAGQARELLRTFEELQLQHEAHRDRLLAEVREGKWPLD